MRNKTQKAITTLSKRLPKAKYIHVQGEVLDGADILNRKLNNDPNFEIDITKKYRHTKPEWRDINHYRKLKKAYSKDGIEGIQKYILWLNQHIIQMNKRLKKAEKMEEIDKSILKIAEGGKTTFWVQLLQFLFAFVNVFKTEKAK